MNTELISVIIPIYNVEDYIEECIDSVIDQTYDNIEILLIDDGSTDASTTIAQRYAGMDDRILYLHKENGGLSDARNFGMKYMKGEFFTFLDSDDILPKEYLQKLMDCQRVNKTDVVMCDFVRMVEGKIDEGSLQLRGKLTAEEVIVNCFKGILAHSACAKLFHKSVAENLSFPLGRYYEDEFALYDVFLRHSVSVTCATKYIYRKREGSITQNEKIDKQNQDLFDALLHVEELIKAEAPEIKYALDFKILQDCMVIIKKDVKRHRRTEISDCAAAKIATLKAENLHKIGTGKSFYSQYKMISNWYSFYRFLFYVMYKLKLNTEA